MPKDRLQTIMNPLKGEMKKIETIVRENTSDVQTPLDSMLRLSLSGGKRLRPALVVLIGRLFKADKRKMHTLAAAVEVLHSATLIHDDIVDDSSVRRGRRTLNATWPPGAAVLAGDYLLARSVSLIAGLNEPFLLDILAGALHNMSKGEITYHYSRRSKNERDVYFHSIEAKTATLFAAAAKMAGVLADRTKREVNALGVFGREFGMAYQIVDDILDITEAENRLGKSVGRDLAQGTITLPVICYSERHKDDKVINRILSGKGTRGNIRTAIKRIRRSGAIEDALGEAKFHVIKSKSALVELPATRVRQTLFDLIDYIVERTH